MQPRFDTFEQHFATLNLTRKFEICEDAIIGNQTLFA